MSVEYAAAGYEIDACRMYFEVMYNAAVDYTNLGIFPEQCYICGLWLSAADQSFSLVIHPTCSLGTSWAWCGTRICRSRPTSRSSTSPLPLRHLVVRQLYRVKLPLTWVDQTSLGGLNLCQK